MSKTMQDERVVQEVRKQNSVGFAILYFGLLIDLLYRQFYLQEPISRYWDLALLFFGVSFYLTAKRVGSGFLHQGQDNKQIILKILPVAIVAAVVNGVINGYWLGNDSVVELVVGGIAFFVSFLAIQFLMNYFSKKKNDDLLK